MNEMGKFCGLVELVGRAQGDMTSDQGNEV